MAKDTHVVEIPVDEEHQQKILSEMKSIVAIQHHPLMEISQSPGHLLLLKLWQRQEDLFGRRIALKETRMDNIRSEIFQLCCFFFAFYGLFLTLIYTSWMNSPKHSCHNWWLPSSLSVFTCFVIIFLVQMKLCRYWKVSRQLQREKSDNRALVRCIQELRMKGASFDLSKEPQNGKRMKSSSVEINWRPLAWCCQNLVTICLVCFAEKYLCHTQTELNHGWHRTWKLKGSNVAKCPLAVTNAAGPRLIYYEFNPQEWRNYWLSNWDEGIFSG